MTPILLLATTSKELVPLHNELLRPYEGCYTVQCAVEGVQAIAFLERLKQQGTPLALVLVDSEESNVLKAVSKDFPNAKRVILATSDDMEASMRQLNMHIDAVLTPPWSPMEEYIFPILDDLLEEITLSCQGQSEETLSASALFIFIGAMPQIEWLNATVARDEQGFILSGSDVSRQTAMGSFRWPLSRAPYHLETSMPGVFVAGDVRSGSVKRAATGVGEGSMSVPSIHNYLATLR